MSVSAREYRATCGGCQGGGAHKTWCPAVHGETAYRLGMMARAAGDLADAVGPNEHGAANHLYAAASLLETKASAVSEDRPTGGNRP